MFRFTAVSCGMIAVSLPASGDERRERGHVPQLQLAAPLERVQPTRAAPAALVDGRVVLTGERFDLDFSTRGPPDTYAFDSYEADATGFPTDSWPGCNFGVPGSRWWFGSTFNNPFVSGDLTTDVCGRGANCEGLYYAWCWNIDEASAPYDDTDGDGRLDQDFFLGVFTSEVCDPNGCTNNGADSVFPGVVYTFLELDDGETDQRSGYYYTNIHNGQLPHQMPSDGSGGWIVVSGTSWVDGGEFVLTAGAGDVWCQPMLWGTGEDEPVHDGRIGTQDFGQYDDINPTDFEHALNDECYDYRYNVCPDPVGGMIAFLYYGGCPNCDCRNDVNNDRGIDLEDLAILLADFGANPPDEPCADLDGDGVVDLSDLGLLLADFGDACP